jgi:signal transduction histidine kinase
VDLEVGRDAAGMIRFTIRDRGIGIPEAEKPQLFASFYRGSNVGDIPGTGLGLAIVKACMDVHGGVLDVQSRPGAGTCVAMSLPDWLRRGSAETFEEVVTA